MATRGWHLKLERGENEFVATHCHLDWLWVEPTAWATTAAASICMAAIQSASIQETSNTTFREGQRVIWLKDYSKTRRVWSVDERPFEYLGDAHLLIRRGDTRRMVPINEVTGD